MGRWEERRGLRERRRPLPEIEVARVRERLPGEESRAAGRAEVHALHVRGIAEVREWTQHQLVDDVEHRGVRADAQAERRHDGGGEPGAAAKAAERVSEVLLEIVEPGDGPPVARVFAYA